MRKFVLLLERDGVAAPAIALICKFGSHFANFWPRLPGQHHIDPTRQPTATMADDDTTNTTTTTGGGIIFDTYTDWWIFLTITVVCWSVVYGVVSKSMRDASERERAA